MTLTTLIVGSFLSGRLQLACHGWRPPAAIAAFTLGTLILCLAAGWITRLPFSDSFTVGLLATIRNGNLGLLLKASLFPAAASASPMANAVLYVVLLYSGASLVVVPSSSSPQPSADATRGKLDIDASPSSTWRRRRRAVTEAGRCARARAATEWDACKRGLSDMTLLFAPRRDASVC